MWIKQDENRKWFLSVQSEDGVDYREDGNFGYMAMSDVSFCNLVLETYRQWPEVLSAVESRKIDLDKVAFESKTDCEPRTCSERLILMPRTSLWTIIHGEGHEIIMPLTQFVAFAVDQIAQHPQLRYWYRLGGGNPPIGKTIAWKSMMSELQKSG